jgi:RNA polymerase sigma factor (TIGR02999 family)
MDWVVGAVDSPENLIKAIYPELREMAARLLRRERDAHTLQRTALVHEAFIRLFGRSPSQVASARDFLALAAHQMRQILIDYGRKHGSVKRGREFERVPLFEGDQGVQADVDQFLSLNEALERLARIDPRALSVVELKFFSGHTNDETAEILGVSDATVEADWQFARSWLFGTLTEKGTRFRV